VTDEEPERPAGAPAEADAAGATGKVASGNRATGEGASGAPVLDGYASDAVVPLASPPHDASARAPARMATFADPAGESTPHARVVTSHTPEGASPSAREAPDAWDRAAAWIMHRGALPGLALLTFGMILIYAGVFRGEVAGDDLTFHMAESARIADCLRVGDFDFWNPNANAGFASAYYYQVVPQLASAIPAAVFGHHLFFFQLSVFLPLVLAPAAAYRGVRLMGATPWQAVIAALVIGFINGESRWGTGNAGTFHVGLYTQTWALAAFPMALGHAVRWATEARGLAAAIVWGAFVTLCHPFAGVSLAVALVAGMLAQLAMRGVDAVLRWIGPTLIGDPARGTFHALCAAIGERWRDLPPRPWLFELGRLAILGVCLAITWMPIWLPLICDYEGFGGFPHRVPDEVGPGFGPLLRWFTRGSIFDHGRAIVLTGALPIVLLLARSRFLRWLWAPAVVYAFWLGIGPHLGKTDDDLIPPVRFLGAMQVVLGLGIGVGFLWICKQIWEAVEGSLTARAGQVLLMIVAAGAVLLLEYTIMTAPPQAGWLVILQRASGGWLSISDAILVAVVAVAVGGVAAEWGLWNVLRSQYAMRTAIAAIAAALTVLLVLPGGRALASRVHVLSDFEGSHGDELHTITWLLRSQPPGRKQVGAGAENHWWNLLSYEYGRRPSLLMMGGGGLQASPNYDFLWTVKDFTKNAWVYDAPILVFEKSNVAKMPKGPTLFETLHYRAIRLPSPGVVSPVQVTGTLPAGRKPAHAAAITWFKTDEPRKDRVLAYPGSGAPGPAPQGTVRRSFRQDSPGGAPDIYAEVDATAPTTFVARESWHPRWHAYLDGHEVPIRRVTPNFPAVDVPSGRHILTFRFERPWWMHASWLPLPLISLLAWQLTRRRRSRSASDPARR
jgi:hypothetical protein